MQSTPTILFKRLKDLNIKIQTHTHPPVFTVNEARIHCGHIEGCHCKNLFLKDKKNIIYLIVAKDTRLINLKELRKKIGSSHLSFGKPGLLLEVLGVKPGSVSPLALINDTKKLTTVILDKEMMQECLLNFHPLTNCLTPSITPRDLLTFVKNTGHLPELIEL